MGMRISNKIQNENGRKQELIPCKRQVVGMFITTCWIPSHVGIRGNKLLTQLLKQDWVSQSPI